MSLNSFVGKLEKSDTYKDFRKKYSDAYLIAGFFVVDFESGNNIHQIDYYIPSTKKIAAFTLDKGVSVQILDGMGTKVPQELSSQTKIDLEALPGIIKDEMRNRSMSEEIKKMIAIIQNIDGKSIWDLSCILSGMELLKSHVEDESETVLKLERTSMFDIIKKMSPDALKQKMQQLNPGTAKEATKEDMEEEMKKLNDIESKIEKEKEEITKKLSKPAEKKAVKKTKKAKS